MIMLRGEIRHNHAALSEAFETIGKRMDGVFGEWLACLAALVEKKNGRSMAELFRDSVDEKLRKKVNLKKEDLEKLCQFGENLGYLDKEMQLSTMDYYMEQIDADKEELGRHLGEQKKLYQCLGVISGLFFVLLLI